MEPSIAAIIESLREIRLADWDQMPDLDLYMDQVISYLKRQLSAFTDANANLVTPSIINNYVKAGMVPRPEKKKYGRPQLSALMMACLLKSVMPISSIKTMVMRDGHAPDEEFYQAFLSDLHDVLDQEAEFLTELTNGEDTPREQLFQLAMCFAMRSNADRYIADRLLVLLNETKDTTQ